jgi:predicted nucleic acid-binding protein
VRFWDSSSLLPLIVREARSPEAFAWLQAAPVVVSWTLTPVEAVSALCRLLREARISETQARVGEQRLHEIVGIGVVIGDVERIKLRAARLLRVHPLRAADAMQLAAALAWVDGQPSGQTFHTFDERLAFAAQREGFEALPAPR